MAKALNEYYEPIRPLLKEQSEVGKPVVRVNPLGLIFTIGVAGRPTVSFKARQLREASELCQEEWFRSDLNSFTSNGEPVCRIGAKLKARIANDGERVKYREAYREVEASDETVMVYLVEIDVVALKTHE